jgi:hypothetical protein
VTKTIDPNSKIATQTKNKNAMPAQQTPENPDLESSVVPVLLFDYYTSLNWLTSYCPNPTVAMACG